MRPDEPVLDVLNQFKRTGVHLAVVREADGAASGLVTLVDVLEALVGDIPSLEERLRPEARQRADGSWLVDGSVAIDDLVDRFGLKGEPLPRDYTTISGLVLAELERIPAAGDAVTWRGLRIEVVDMDGRRIDKLLVART